MARNNRSHGMFDDDAGSIALISRAPDGVERPIQRGPLRLRTGAARATPIPPALVGAWRRATPEERARLAVPVLRAARRLIIDDGWCQGALRDLRGRWSLYGAVAEAGRGRLEAEYAREMLRDVLRRVDLPQWNDAPERLRSEVTELLARAERRAKRIGGLVRRGGWRVAS